MKTGVELIAEERKRHPEKGWTPEHDAGHTNGSLAVHAATLAVDGTDAKVIDPLCRGTPHIDEHGEFRDGDCWGLLGKHGYRGSDPDHIHCLVVAGALIAAEIDRLTPQQQEPESQKGK